MIFYARKWGDEAWTSIRSDTEDHVPDVFVREHVRSVIGGVTFVEVSPTMNRARLTQWRVEQLTENSYFTSRVENGQMLAAASVRTR